MNTRSRLPRRTALQAAMYALALAACRPNRDATPIPTPLPATTIPPLPTQTPPPTATAQPSATPNPDFHQPEGDQLGFGWLRFGEDDEYGLIQFTPDSRQLITASSRSGITFWDMASGQRVKSLEYPRPRGSRIDNPIWDFAYSSNGTLIVIMAGRVDAWNIAAGTYQSLTEEHQS